MDTFNSKIDKLILFIDTINSNTKEFNIKIDKKEFIQHIYYINKLLFELYNIYNKNTKKEQIKQIQKLKTPDGDFFLTRTDATYIVEHLAEPLSNLYSKIYDLQKKAKNNPMYGGSISNPLDKATLLFNWIFFPLWSMENTPILGEFSELYLDLMGNVLGSMDIFLEPLAPLLGIGMSSALDVVQSIPGIGTGASAIAIPLNFAEGPMEWLFGNFGDIIGLFLNISRKQWGLAYMSALQVIPNLANIMDAYVGNVYTANKWLKRVNQRTGYVVDVLELINNNVSTYVPIIQEILKNPFVLNNPSKLFDIFIIPNYKKIPGLKKLSKKELNTIRDNIQELTPALNTFIENPFVYTQNPDLFYTDIVEPILKKLKNERDDKYLEIANKVIKNINKRMNMYIKGL